MVRRMESGRRSIWEIVPISSMMPVNISALPVGIICRNQDIVFVELCRIVDQWHAFVEGVDAHAPDGRQGPGAADDFVTDEGVDLIDQAGIEEAALDGAAAFDEDARQPFVVEELQGIGQIDGLAVLERCQEDADAGVLQSLHLFDGTKGRRDDDGLRRLIRDDEGIEGRPAFRIEDDAHRLVRLFLVLPFDAARQERIVREDRVDADEDAVVDRAQVVAVAAGPFVGDPLGFPCPRSRAAVEALSQFNGDEWFLDHHVLDEDFVQLGRFLREEAYFYGDAGLAQDSRAFAGDQRVRVEHGHDDFAHALFDERPGTGRRAAVVGARGSRRPWLP